MQNALEAVNILKYAAEMEKSGQAFFLEKSEQFQNPVTRKLFLDLAEIEESHYRFIVRQQERYSENPDDFTVSEDVKSHDESTFFAQRDDAERLDVTLTESQVPDLNVLRMAYLIERDFKEFYADAVDLVDDPELKSLFEMLSRWESGHEKLFKGEYDRLKREYLTMPWGG